MSERAVIPSRNTFLLFTFFLFGFVLPQSAAAEARPSETYGRLPLHFEANLGQTNEDVRFLARGPGYSVYLTAGEAVVVLAKPNADAKRDAHATRERLGTQTRATPIVVRMSLVGAATKPLVSGLDELPGKANYFIGKDPAKWRTNVPTYAKVRYHEVYPGIDLVYYGNQRRLEYDFLVAPGADPNGIVIGFQGAERLEIDAQGELVLHVAGDVIRQRVPVIYQETDGVRTKIEGRYVLKDAHRVGFQVTAYDRSQSLVIDPVLVYSTYLGGSGSEQALGIAVDAAGAAYVTGFTTSADFTLGCTAPCTVLDATLSGGVDAFVTKLDPTGSALLYSTYLGGSGSDQGSGIAVDAAGAAYVTGFTTSADFTAGCTAPCTVLDPTLSGGSDAFVTKLDPTGSALLYSTYLGGSADDAGVGIAVDDAGAAYVTGFTTSADFTLGCTAPCTVLDATLGGFADAFVAKLNATGTALVYSTYLGGSGDEFGLGIAVDAAGAAYVTGVTQSTDFTAGCTAPCTVMDDSLGGSADAFVVKIADIMSAPAPTPGKVSLGGFIDSAGNLVSESILLLRNGPVPGGKATFGGNVQFQSADPSPTGNVRYRDHVTGDDIKATSFSTLVIGTGPCGPDTHALIIGKATVNGVPDQDLQINVDDCSEPGSQQPGTSASGPDMLIIMTGPTQVYMNGGPLVGGNIQVKKAQ